MGHLSGGECCAGVRGGAARWQQRGPLEGRQRHVGCGRRGPRGSDVGEGVLAGRVASGWARRGDGTTRPRCGDDGPAAVEASTGRDRQQGGQAEGRRGDDGEAAGRAATATGGPGPPEHATRDHLLEACSRGQATRALRQNWGHSLKKKLKFWR